MMNDFMIRKEIGSGTALKPLPNKFRKNGYNYILIIRNDKVACYEQEYTENLKYYKVFIVQVNPAHKFMGKAVPSREVFPSYKEIKKTAWIYKTMKGAFRKVVELTKQNMTSNKV